MLEKEERLHTDMMESSICLSNLPPTDRRGGRYGAVVRFGGSGSLSLWHAINKSPQRTFTVLDNERTLDNLLTCRESSSHFQLPITPPNQPVNVAMII